MLNKIWKTLLLVFVFILPWQTRLIYGPKFLNGGFWEYGSESLFATEILLWIIIIIFLLDQFRRKTVSHLFGRIHYETHKNNLFLGVGFILFLSLAVIQSLNQAVSYNYVFSILGGLCISFVIATFFEKIKLYYTFWASAVVQAGFGIWQFFNQEVVANKWLGLAAHKPAELGSFVVEFGDERWLRAYGGFGSPNILGGFLAVAFVLGSIIYLFSKPATKIFLIFGQAVILTGLVMSFSRGAWVAGMMGFILVGIYILRRGGDNTLSFFKRFELFAPYIKQSIFYIIIFIGLFSLLSPLFFVRFNPAYRLEAKSLQERKNQYEQSYYILKKNILFGVGPGAYTYATYKNNPTKKVYDYQPVHNIYLLILCEWGVIGFGVWSVLFVFVAREIYRRRPAYLPVIFTLLVLGAFDHFLWSLPGGVVLWWVVFAMLI